VTLLVFLPKLSGHASDFQDIIQIGVKYLNYFFLLSYSCNPLVKLSGNIFLKISAMTSIRNYIKIKKVTKKNKWRIDEVLEDFSCLENKKEVQVKSFCVH
jgi:hypothetical protein